MTYLKSPVSTTDIFGCYCSILTATLHLQFPELMERLQRMYSIMENRVTQLGTFTRLQGRLELMLSQIARQKDDEQGVEATAALLTLQDGEFELCQLSDMPVEVTCNASASYMMWLCQLPPTIVPVVCYDSASCLL